MVYSKTEIYYGTSLCMAYVAMYVCDDISTVYIKLWAAYDICSNAKE